MVEHGVQAAPLTGHHLLPMLDSLLELIMNQTAESTAEKKRKSMTGRIVRRLIIFPMLAIAGLYFLSMTSSKPTNLGVVDGQLAKCPDSPNCVSTQTDDPKKTMMAVPFIGDSAQTLAKIKTAISSDCPRAKLCTESESYLHYEFTSLLFRFVDDVEFHVDDSNQVVHFRSASRVGHSDLGANRKRMKKICESLNQ